MSRWPVLLVGALLLVGCSAEPSVSGTCQTAAVEAEIESLLSESHLEVRQYRSLVCEGAWAYVLADVGEVGQEPFEDHFLMRRDGDLWILKSPESSCIDDELPPTVYEAACGAAA